MHRLAGWIGLLLIACGGSSAEDENLGDGQTGGTDGAGASSSGGSIVEPFTGGSAGESAGGAPAGGGSAAGGAANTGGESSSGGSGTGDSGDDCAFSGSVTYQLNNPGSWPESVIDLITEAMDQATYYYNCYADLTKSITVNYNPGVPTAEANVDGWLSFGSNTGYMQVATAMHEISHTLGVGYYPWTQLLDDGRFTGAAVNSFMQNIPAEERDPDQYSQRTYITADSQHFWPYGLNQASEYQSEWSLINHVRIVAAIQIDKQAYLDQN
jgi:hypothetical protein